MKSIHRFIGSLALASALISVDASAQATKQRFNATGSSEEAVLESLQQQANGFVHSFQGRDVEVKITYNGSAEPQVQSSTETFAVRGKQTGTKKVGGRKLKVKFQSVVVKDRCRGNQWRFPVKISTIGSKRKEIPQYEHLRRSVTTYTGSVDVEVTPKPEKPIYAQKRVITTENVVPKQRPSGGGSKNTAQRKPSHSSSPKTKSKNSSSREVCDWTDANGVEHKGVPCDQVPANAIFR